MTRWRGIVRLLIAIYLLVTLLTGQLVVNELVSRILTSVKPL